MPNGVQCFYNYNQAIEYSIQAHNRKGSYGCCSETIETFSSGLVDKGQIVINDAFFLCRSRKCEQCGSIKYAGLSRAAHSIRCSCRLVLLDLNGKARHLGTIAGSKADSPVYKKVITGIGCCMN